MAILEKLISDDYHYAQANFMPGGPYGLPSLACTLLVIVGYFIYHQRSRGRTANLTLFWRWLLPRKLVFHRSTMMDLRLWLLNGIIIGATYFWLAVSGAWVREATMNGIASVFGQHAAIVWPAWLVTGMATVAFLLAYELAYWFGHYLFHRYAFLWEFHKVHHSAEVMTSLTELRQHPIEILAFVNLIALSTGFTLGAMAYVFGPDVGYFKLFNANILLIGFLMTWGHLRHTHIWWSFTGIAGRLFQSPAHHQLHHSDHPDHWDKNLGFSLAVWDWVFGTLVIPPTDRKVLNVRFGVGETNGDFDTVARVFVRPFIASAGQLMPAPAQPTAPAASSQS